MTENQKRQVAVLRNQGIGCEKIAQQTGLSKNTIKSFCRRNNLKPPMTVAVTSKEESVCECCGNLVLQAQGRKKKRFCSDSCRNRWWNAHLDIVKRKANYNFTCPVCKKHFVAYGNARRKYCSHSCYIQDRFGGNAL